jgi:hypothetical protein
MIAVARLSRAGFVRMLLAAGALALFPASASAEKYDGLPEKCLAFFAQGKPIEAVEFVEDSHNLYTKEDRAAFEALKFTLSARAEALSDYKYHELVAEEKIGSRYVLLVYAVGVARAPFKVVMVLYRPKDKWQFDRFHCGDFDVNKFKP